MANTCTSQGNFNPNTTDLRYGRPVTQLVLDNTTNSTLDGSLSSASYASVLCINQLNLTYTNGTAYTLLVTPVFIRPPRLVQTSAPQELYVDERWAATSGAAPANPTLGASIATFGGGPSNFSQFWRYGSIRDAGCTYAPLGQFTIAPTQQLKVSYDAKLRSNGSTGGGSRYLYARNHRIVFIADITADQTV